MNNTNKPKNCQSGMYICSRCSKPFSKDRYKDFLRHCENHLKRKLARSQTKAKPNETISPQIANKMTFGDMERGSDSDFSTRASQNMQKSKRKCEIPKQLKTTVKSSTIHRKSKVSENSKSFYEAIYCIKKYYDKGKFRKRRISHRVESAMAQKTIRNKIRSAKLTRKKPFNIPNQPTVDCDPLLQNIVQYKENDKVNEAPPESLNLNEIPENEFIQRNTESKGPLTDDQAISNGNVSTEKSEVLLVTKKYQITDKSNHIEVQEIQDEVQNRFRQLNFNLEPPNHMISEKQESLNEVENIRINQNSKGISILSESSIENCNSNSAENLSVSLSDFNDDEVKNMQMEVDITDKASKLLTYKDQCQSPPNEIKNNPSQLDAKKYSLSPNKFNCHNSLTNVSNVEDSERNYSQQADQDDQEASNMETWQRDLGFQNVSNMEKFERNSIYEEANALRNISQPESLTSSCNQQGSPDVSNLAISERNNNQHKDEIPYFVENIGTTSSLEKDDELKTEVKQEILDCTENSFLTSYEDCNLELLAGVSGMISDNDIKKEKLVTEESQQLTSRIESLNKSNDYVNSYQDCNLEMLAGVSGMVSGNNIKKELVAEEMNQSTSRIESLNESSDYVKIVYEKYEIKRKHYSIKSEMQVLDDKKVKITVTKQLIPVYQPSSRELDLLTKPIDESANSKRNIYKHKAVETERFARRALVQNNNPSLSVKGVPVLKNIGGGNVISHIFTNENNANECFSNIPARKNTENGASSLAEKYLSTAGQPLKSRPQFINTNTSSIPLKQEGKRNLASESPNNSNYNTIFQSLVSNETANLQSLLGNQSHITFNPKNQSSAETNLIPYLNNNQLSFKNEKSTKNNNTEGAHKNLNQQMAHSKLHNSASFAANNSNNLPSHDKSTYTNRFKAGQTNVENPSTLLPGSFSAIHSESQSFSKSSNQPIDYSDLNKFRSCATTSQTNLPSFENSILVNQKDNFHVPSSTFATETDFPQFSDNFTQCLSYSNRNNLGGGSAYRRNNSPSFVKSTRDNRCDIVPLKEERESAMFPYSISDVSPEVDLVEVPASANGRSDKSSVEQHRFALKYPTCIYCKAIISSDKLLTHIGKFHPEVRGSYNIFKNELINNRRTFLCCKCDLLFVSAEDLLIHNSKHHQSVNSLSPDSNYSNEEQRTYTCRTCNKRYIKLPSLLKHLESHQENYRKCCFCFIGFLMEENSQVPICNKCKERLQSTISSYPPKTTERIEMAHKNGQI